MCWRYSTKLDAQCDKRRCRIKLTILAVVDGQFITLSCLQLDARGAARRAGPSTTADALIRPDGTDVNKNNRHSTSALPNTFVRIWGYAFSSASRYLALQLLLLLVLLFLLLLMLLLLLLLFLVLLLLLLTFPCNSSCNRQWDKRWLLMSSSPRQTIGCAM